MSTIQGETFAVEKSEVTQARLDGDAVRELLTPDQIRKCQKTITFSQYKTSRYKGEKPKFQMPNLSNVTAAGLVDMLGDTREKIKELQKLEGIYKEALEARLQEKAEEGAK